MMKSQPVLIGIAGGSGCGKTHLARNIQAAASGSVALLSMDQYFETEATGDPRNLNFDHPAHLDLDQLASDLECLKAGRPVRAPMYDFRSMRQAPAALPMEPLPVVLVEGLFVLAEPFASLLDMAFFLDVADDQRLLGRILRDVKERGASVEEIVDRYQRFVRPSYQVFVEPTKYNANLVVDFTYRRALFSAFICHIVRDYVAGGLDLADFLKNIGPERIGWGFDLGESFMPVSVDIRELARAYPESVRDMPDVRLRR